MQRATSLVLIASACLALGACVSTPLNSAASADASTGTQSFKKLPRKGSERVAVTVYEFRSSITGLSPQTATDMFKTALVHSGQFRVLERSRLNEGVAREKQLQAGGFASGKAGAAQLSGAQYVFEGTVSEANSAERQRSGSVGVAGAQVGGGSTRDSIAVDVRVVNAGNGEIVDAVTVRKRIGSDEVAVSGIGNLLATVAGQRGKVSPYTPDAQVQQRRAEGVDSSVRAAIDEAVLQLAKRFEP